MTTPQVLPVAVYGTLRPGGRAWQAFDLASRTRHLGPCLIAGRIVDLGGYPGLIPPRTADDHVVGDLLVIDEIALIDELDAFEGDGYVRETVTLIDPPIAAQLWRWVGGTDDAAPVPGNDWARRQSAEFDPTHPVRAR